MIVNRKRPFIASGKRKAVLTKKRKVLKKSSKRKVVPIKKTKLQTKSKKKSRKQPVYDSSDEEEEDEEIINPKTKRELEQNWLRFSEQEDSDSREGEEVDEESDPEEEEEDFRPQPRQRSGPGRIVYEDDDVSPEQATLEHAFYNPHLYDPRRCAC